MPTIELPTISCVPRNGVSNSSRPRMSYRKIAASSRIQNAEIVLSVSVARVTKSCLPGGAVTSGSFAIAEARLPFPSRRTH